MSAAVELASQNIPVSVFEAANTLGGRARRVETNGLALDNGLHILVGAYGETLRMIRAVNGSDESARLLRSPLNLRVEPHFRLRAPRLPRPLHVAAALLFARGLNLAEKLAAIRFMQSIKSHGFHCDPGITVTTLLKQHRQTSEITDVLWNPLCVAALNTPPDQADAQIFLNVLRDSLAGPRSSSDVLLPKVDFTALFPEPAANYVRAHGGEVHTGQTVAAVQLLDDGFELATASAQRYSHVIIAVGPHRLAKLAENIPQLAPQLEIVGQFDYQPIYSVFLQYPRHISLPEAMIGMRAGPVQWVFDRGRLCNQPGMLGVVISASGYHQTLAREELAQRVHEQLAQRFSLPQPQWHQVIAEKRATFAATPRLRRPSNLTAVPGLLLAGDYTDSPYPATLEAAVRSGLACARHITNIHD
jgi:squalene-associated FAD-dependent desaturase